jgi:hypothetical protein
MAVCSWSVAVVGKACFRRHADIEDGHPLAGVAVYLELLLAPEHVAVEAHRVVVVVGFDDQAHVQDAAGGCHHRRVGR